MTDIMIRTPYDRHVVSEAEARVMVGLLCDEADRLDDRERESEAVAHWLSYGDDEEVDS